MPNTISTINPLASKEGPWISCLYYLPPVDWFAMLVRQPAVTLEQMEHYQKGSFRNRCYIAGPNDVQRLSVPLVKGKHKQQQVREVRIAYDEPWQLQHWRSITTAYGRAPFFEHYGPQLQSFFEKRWDFLFDFNLALLVWTCKSLRIPFNYTLTDAYLLEYPPLCWDSRQAFIPDADPLVPVEYPQLFEDRHGFLSNLSILDLLFCAGPEAQTYLRKGLHKIEI